jgi:hypothetical protein
VDIDIDAPAHENDRWRHSRVDLVDPLQRHSLAAEREVQAAHAARVEELGR